MIIIDLLCKKAGQKLGEVAHCQRIMTRAMGFKNDLELI